MATKPTGVGPFIGQNVEASVALRQRLGLSAQMRQKLHLLQMPVADLSHFIEREIERNPLLTSRSYQNSTVGVAPMGRGEQDFSVSDWLDKQSAHRTPTLQEHVAEQIIFSFADAPTRRIAFYLSEELDEAGYFTGDTALLAHQLDVPVALVDEVLCRCQNFDPPGLFARSLAQCLELQLKRQQIFDSVWAQLLQGLPLLVRHDFTRLALLCGLTQETLMRRCAILKKLDPKPGLAFTSPHDQVDNPMIIVDAFIEAQEDGSYRVELNDAVLPKLILDRDYRQIIGTTKEERHFIRSCRLEAHGLIRALEARAQTLLKVISAIIMVQKDFLHAGSAALKPLTLAKIAAVTSLHESTISRTIANKYVAIRQKGHERGPYGLRNFFSNALVSTSGGASFAAKAIETRIAQLIAAEKTPLSDAALAQLLTSQGVSIARRTVAKYREKLRIAPSHQRKREKYVPNSFN